MPRRAPRWREANLELFAALGSLPPSTNPYLVAATLLPLLAANDATRHVMSLEGELRRARRIIQLVAASVALPESPQRAQKASEQTRIADVLATAIGLPSRSAAQIDMALLLCAEHELNASTFAARVAASTQADLYACLSAALGTHSGPRQGQAVDRVLAMLDELRGHEDAATIMQTRLERGESIAGFGHNLYPHGDPRAAPLMKSARALASDSDDLESLWKLVGAAADAQYYPPNLDMGIAMLAVALGIPREKACCLFMVGRFAGWIAHILEQREQKTLLRPRAAYSSISTSAR